MAAMATHIPEASSGLWYVKRYSLAKPLTVMRTGGPLTMPPGTYTQLWRYTEATLHVLGELVMQDTQQELNTHLNFMLRARGKVLITGLGLGCVTRGCLANPNVERVTVIERDPDVLKLVRPYMEEGERLEIIVADALQWTRENPRKFDSAWHDLWNDPDTEEPHLQVMHSELLLNCSRKVPMQGAWHFPRDHKRLWKKHIQVV